MADEKVEKTENEWQAKLTPEQFQVTRKAGTEAAFSGKYWDTKDDGVYHCICCDAPLFESSTKYDSGTGWPSFFQPLDSESVVTKIDDSMGVRRIEVECARCSAHLGHVFPDGPAPSGQRYCMNSASLALQTEDPE